LFFRKIGKVKMRKYVDDVNNLDAVILLLEILEIKTENKIIKEL